MSDYLRTRRVANRRVPWIDPSKPLPKWLTEFEALSLEERKASFTRNQLRAREYYLQLYKATPRWETRARLATIYDRATRLRNFGARVHVDHIVPLNSPIVCGLHCLENLQIITERENYAKSNRDFPGSPFEQLSLLDEADKQEELNL